MTAEFQYVDYALVRGNRNLMTLPGTLERLGIVHGGEPVHWAYNEPDDRVYLSRWQDAFADDDAFRYLGSTSASPARTVRLPERVSALSAFTHGAIVHFVTTGALIDEQQCFLVSNDQLKALSGDARSEP